MFIYSESDYYKRPSEGYTYIYIYSLDNLYLYVGQTIQSLQGRYKNHITGLSRTSGAEYANSIAYFQIKNEYANYAEGYIARRLQGICQRGVPNPDHFRHNVPKDVQKTLQQIANKLINRKADDITLKTGYTPLFSVSIENNGCTKEVLAIFNMLINNDNIISHYNKVDYYRAHKADLYLNFVETYDKRITGYITFRPELDYRPTIILKVNNVSDISKLRNAISNYPLYCLVDSRLYDKFKNKIENIIRYKQIGLMVQRPSEIITIQAFHKNFRILYKAQKHKKDFILNNKRDIRLCVVSNYKAELNGHGYYQIA